MWLVKTCVWGFCVSVFKAKEKASINRPVMGMKSCVRVFWGCGSGSGGGTRGVTGFRTLFRKRITIRCQSVLKRRKTGGAPYYGVVRNTSSLRLSVVAQPYKRPSSSGKSTVSHPRTTRKRPFSRVKIIDPELSGILLSIRNAPEQNCRKTGHRPLAVCQ
jgi:hypothetical protein